MGINGHSIRILCDALCLLHYEGINYHGVIENISLSGALIKMSGKMPEGIRPGDTCGLMLCRTPEVCPIEYNCRVVRLAPAQVGVQFLEMNIAD